MKLTHLSQLIQLWDRDDNNFRQRIRRDPKGTIEGYGIEVTAEEEEAIRKTDWTLSDDELEVVLVHLP